MSDHYSNRTLRIYHFKICALNCKKKQCSILILTLIPCYSYIPPQSPHHLVQQTHDSSSPNKQPSEQHVSYCNWRINECSEPNQTTMTIILPREVKLTLSLLCRSPLHTSWSRSSAYWMLLFRGCCHLHVRRFLHLCCCTGERQVSDGPTGTDTHTTQVRWEDSSVPKQAQHQWRAPTCSLQGGSVDRRGQLVLVINL